MPTVEANQRRKSIEAWWMLGFSIITGLVGLAMGVALVIYYLRTGKTSVALIAFAVGLCGPIIAASAGAFVQTIRGSTK